MRGIRVLISEQENRGGTADHFNLLSRAETKEKSKREALQTFLDNLTVYGNFKAVFIFPG